MGEVPRWAAVVVNYESGPLLGDCVRSLLDDAGVGTPEIVVVDNGSTDGSVDALRRSVPEVAVVDPGRNLGYAGAANRGIAATRAPVVVVCNCDARLHPGTATALLERFDAESTLGAAGPAVFDEDGTRYPSARNEPTTGDAVGHAVVGLVTTDNRFTRRYREVDADPAVARDVDWVSGAAIWLRRTALDAVGGWDERYFMYVEDVDLCRRLRLAGWRIAYEPGGAVTHVHGASTDRHPYRMIAEHHRSLYRFASSRWTGPKRALLVPTAGFLGVRAGVAMGVRAVRRPRGRPDRGSAARRGTAEASG